jgi:hypothetical protein
MESRERIGMSCFNRATGIVVRVTVPVRSSCCSRRKCDADGVVIRPLPDARIVGDDTC